MRKGYEYMIFHGRKKVFGSFVILIGGIFLSFEQKEFYFSIGAVIIFIPLFLLGRYQIKEGIRERNIEKNKGQKSNMLINNHEHSVIPSLDYPFATEFYDKSDNRYKVVKTFENLIWETKKIKVYNCKIENINIKNVNNTYNVYIYLKDIKKTLGNEYSPLFHRNEDFIKLFYEALKECPIKELEGKKLNPNGIFILDFLTCARCYAINKAYKEIENAIKKRNPTIEFIIIWDETIYMFFHRREGLEEFLKEDIVAFKNFCYNIIEPFDTDCVWKADNLTFMLDIYKNYRTIGGRNYFNSDAMSAGVFI